MVKKVIKNIKKNVTKKKIKNFIKEHKVAVIGVITALLLAAITLYVSFAFFQITDTETVVGGSVGEIADIKIIIMAQDRNSSGAPVANAYSQYGYVPKAGYTYNSTKSYCVNGSTLTYDSSDFSVNAQTSRTDTCYAYFDAKDNLDIVLNVYLEDVDSNGNGLGTYSTKLESFDMPAGAYAINTSQSSCTNNATVSYDSANNKFYVESAAKTVCNVYMNVLNPDIAVTVYLQDREGINSYYKSKKIPENIYYSLNSSKSSCTNGATMTLEKQAVKVATSNRTKCVAYLDISNGPLIESAEVTGVTASSISLQLRASNSGSAITTWYYSTNGGSSYTSTTSTTPTITGLNSYTDYEILIYGVDANNKQSREITVNAKTLYVFNGIYAYQAAAYSKTIEVSGYYKLQVWGAQGGNAYTSTASTYVGGKGGYSQGVVYLNENDTIYIYTGGQGVAGSNTQSVKTGGTNGGGNSGTYYGGSGGGASDIRINNDSLYSRVIVAGGGGGAAYYSGYVGGVGGGTEGLYGTGYNSTYRAKGGTATAGGAAGGYSGYTGTAGDFGIGGNGNTTSTSYNRAGGGGAGWYGGGGAGYRSSSKNYYNGTSGGGGGSGFVYTSSTAANVPSGWLLDSSYYLTSASTTAGNVSFTSTSGGTETGHAGSGYALVTYCGSTAASCS